MKNSFPSSKAMETFLEIALFNPPQKEKKCICAWAFLSLCSSITCSCNVNTNSTLFKYLQDNQFDFLWPLAS